MRFNSSFKEKQQLLMKKYEDGVHEIVLEGDYKGYFYTFLIDEKYEKIFI